MKKNFIYFFVLLFVVTLVSCENTLDVTLPQGPEGPEGPKGDPGKSAFELWVEYYGKDPETSIEEFFNSMKGKDGKDGDVPYVGDNGNWWVGDKDTGVPAQGTDGNDGKDGTTPTIGDNGNWFIDDKDTGIPAQGKDGADGKDGVNGKTAYELWKEAVDRCDGTVTNKDGSAYDCSKNTWQHFLTWLQGGDTSVLYKYWITLPGNGGKTMYQFITELFDCHCSSISVNLNVKDVCIELNIDGTLKVKQTAELTVYGKGGTSIHITGTGIDIIDSIASNLNLKAFNIPRGDEDIVLSVKCVEDTKVVTKTISIPALKYIKLDGAISMISDDIAEEDLVTIKFTTAPSELIVNGVVVYKLLSGVTFGSGWTVTDAGKTFTKKYKRTSRIQEVNVEVIGANGECSTINKAFVIQRLIEPDVPLPTISIVGENDCELLLTATGVNLMTVKASYGTSPTITVTLTYVGTDPATNLSIYSGLLPKTYEGYVVTIIGEKEGHIDCTQLVAVHPYLFDDGKDYVSLESTNDYSERDNLEYFGKMLVNNTNDRLAITITRSDNTNTKSSELANANLTYPHTFYLEANTKKRIDFPKDFVPNYLERGNYPIVIEARKDITCLVTKRIETLIPNTYIRPSNRISLVSNPLLTNDLPRDYSL